MKKEGRIAKVYRLGQEGASVKESACANSENQNGCESKFCVISLLFHALVQFGRSRDRSQKTEILNLHSDIGQAWMGFTVKEQAVLDEVLTQAYRRMHRYTCAEASLQALLTLWDLPKEGFSWATAGYMGAIRSGQTTCGLLIGSSIAVGFRCGQGKKGVPEDHEGERGRAILAVEELYSNFLKKFGSTECKALNKGLNFSNEEEMFQWAAEKRYKQTCDVFLRFIFEECEKMAEEGKM